VKIETTRLGIIEVQDEKVITMPAGMIGFPHRKRFVILQHKAHSPFFWYQSLEDPGLAFLITNPRFFLPDYGLDLQQIERATHWNGTMQEGGNLEFYVTVRIPRGDPRKMTANLVGPIVVNTRLMEAVQVVLADGTHSHRHPLIH